MLDKLSVWLASLYNFVLRGILPRSRCMGLLFTFFLIFWRAFVLLYISSLNLGFDLGQIFISGVDFSMAFVRPITRAAIWDSSLALELSNWLEVGGVRSGLAAMYIVSVLRQQSWLVFFQFFRGALSGFATRIVWNVVVIERWSEWWSISLRSHLMMLFHNRKVEYIRSIVNLPFLSSYVMILGGRRKLSP